jgi:hypothetical protein
MTETPATTAGRTNASAPSRPLGQSTEDITPEWMEDMVERLFKECRRQLAQVNTAKTGADAQDTEDNKQNVLFRERNAKTFATLVSAAHSLADLQLKLEKTGRTKAFRKTVNARKSLERKLVKLANATAVGTVSRKP